MPIKKYDTKGNPFQVGWVYELHGHTLEMVSFKENGESGEFILTKNHGVLLEGKRLKLNLSDDYKPLYPVLSFCKTNKAASILLEEEW